MFFQPFDDERTWKRLFQESTVHTIVGIYVLNIKLYESDIVSVYIIVLATVRWVFSGFLHP
jgi:hypothetical protein